MRKKVLMGMSGGVDSSAAALLLLEQGYDVTGCTLKLFPEADEKNIRDSRNVCEKLGITHTALDFTEDFKKYVMENFASEYILGRTPNPCIMCNKFLKFGKMLEAALSMGFDFIATGHYAGIFFDENTGKYLLKRGTDPKKDQSYVLYTLTQEILSHTLFPLYSHTKEEIREIARSHGFVNAQKRDSEDICFVPDGDYAGFITRFTGKTPACGNFIDKDGNKVGRHNGIINYTIGQRRGLGVTFGKPVFVTEKNAEENTVTLGTSEELMKKEIFLGDVNFISSDNPLSPVRVTAKTRYSAKEQPAVLFPLENDLYKAVFDESVRAAASGQACVFYAGDHVAGGGTII